MKTNTIDVAKIMQEIRAGIIQKQDEDEVLDTYCIRKQEEEIRHVIFDIPSQYLAELNRITDFINNTRNEAAAYHDMGIRLPNYEGFGFLLRKLLIIFSRFVRKSTRFFTKEQAIVNRNYDCCLKALTESDEAIYRGVTHVFNELSARCMALESVIDGLLKEEHRKRNEESKFYSAMLSEIYVRSSRSELRIQDLNKRIQEIENHFVKYDQSNNGSNCKIKVKKKERIVE